MKNLILFAVLTLVYFTPINAQKCQQDTVYTYKLTGSSYQKNHYLRNILTYNSNDQKTLDIEQKWIHSAQFYRNNYKSEFEYHNQFKDKTIKQKFSIYDTINQVWNPENMSEFSYDNNGNIINSSNSEWNKTVMNWIKKNETIYSYNSQNKRLNETVKNYVPHLNSLRNEYNITFNYDANNNETLRETNVWDTVSNQFISYSRTITTYSTTNKVLTETGQYWDKTSSTWINTNRITQTYTSSDRLEFFYYDTWNTTTNSWNKSSRSQNVYSSQDLLITEYSDQWDNMASIYNPYYKKENTYNSNYLIESYITYLYNSTFSRWDKNRNAQYNYNQNDKLIKEINNVWDNANNNWRYETVNNYNYNSGDTLIYQDRNQWSTSLNTLIKESYETHQYNVNNPLYIEEYYNWFNTTSNFYERVFRVEHICKYANTSIKETQLKTYLIYPNPVNTGFIRIKSNNISNYEIIGLDGKVIQKGIAYDNEIVNISHLIKGIYFIKIDQETIKFIID